MPTLGAILPRLTKRGTLEPTSRSCVNTPEQNKPPPLRRSQWRDVFKCTLYALIFSSAVFALGIGAIVLNVGFVGYAAHWLVPFDLFQSFFRSSASERFEEFICLGGPLAWWFAGWFMLVWIARFGSLTSKLAMLVCVAFAMFMVSLNDHFEHRVDFTERRLDVSRSIFEPGMLILAGTIKPLNAPEPRGTFEIRIAGPDYYFIHQSWPDSRDCYSARDTEIATPGWSGWHGHSPNSRRLGGCFRHPRQLEIFEKRPRLMPGRGLWNTNALAGATVEGQSVVDPERGLSRSLGEHREEYHRLDRIGRWQIPREIIFHDPARLGAWVYSVHRMELLALPDHNWFEQAKANLFIPGRHRRTIRETETTSPVPVNNAPTPPAPPPGR